VGGEEGYAYVAWIKSEPSLKAVSASRSGKVAKVRAVGRLPILCVTERRVEFALLLSLPVLRCEEILPTQEQTVREVIFFFSEGHGNK
jgi:hypothetical protein